MAAAKPRHGELAQSSVPWLCHGYGNGSYSGARLDRLG